MSRAEVGLGRESSHMMDMSVEENSAPWVFHSSLRHPILRKTI